MLRLKQICPTEQQRKKLILPYTSFLPSFSPNIAKLYFCGYKKIEDEDKDGDGDEDEDEDGDEDEDEDGGAG